MGNRKKIKKQYSIAEARDQLAHLVHEVEDGTVIELTRRNEPVAAVISMQEYRKLRTDEARFWDKLQEFRKQMHSEDYLEPDDLKGIRDKSPGRSIDF